MAATWILVKNGKRSPMIDGFYYVELAIYRNKDDLYPKDFIVTIAQYKFENGWSLPKEYDGVRVKIISYNPNRIKIPKKQLHNKEEAV